MADISTSIPVRANGDDVFAEWFNILRQWLIYLAGGGAIGETQFTVANNQASAANVTDLVFSSASHRGAVVEMDVTRKTDTASSEVRCRRELTLAYRQESASWVILDETVFGDYDGLTLTITAAGQVQYVSTNIAGANYVGKMNFRARTWNV